MRQTGASVHTGPWVLLLSFFSVGDFVLHSEDQATPSWNETTDDDQTCSSSTGT